MKPMHRTKWFGILALTAIATASQDPLLIRRELKAGATEKYVVESVVKQNIEIPSMGEQDMIITTAGSIILKTGEVNSEKGTAAVETTTKIEKMSMDGSLASMMGGANEQKLPDPKVEKGTLDSRNRLVLAVDPKAKTPGGMMGMGMPGMGSVGAAGLLNLIELPEKAIKIGDEIEVAMPGAAGAATMGAKDFKLKVKFVGEKEVEGGKAWVVSFSGNVKIDIDTAKMPKQPNQPDNPMGDMKISGTVLISGEGLVDKLSGRTLSNIMNMKTDMKVFVEAAGMEIPSKGTITMKLELAK